MKERPILFSGDMVRAILEGRKTQTRRIIKPQPSEEYSAESLCCEHYNPVIVDRHGDMDAGPEIFGVYSTDGEWGVKCPYGQPGDRLWVRETWGAWPHAMGGVQRESLRFRADGEYQNEHGAWSWRPSIHMPRWASRITLEITGVRVERLQDISETDAFSEGIDTESDDYNRAEHAQIGGASIVEGSAAQFAYRGLWEQINGEGSWTHNPWVWVIEFKRI